MWMVGETNAYRLRRMNATWGQDTRKKRERGLWTAQWVEKDLGVGKVPTNLPTGTAEFKIPSADSDQDK